MASQSARHSKQSKPTAPRQATKQTAQPLPAALEQTASDLVQRAASAPSSLSPRAVQRLERAYGNRAVSRLIGVSGQQVIQRQVMSTSAWKNQAGLGWFYRLSSNPCLVPLYQSLQAYHAVSPKDRNKQIAALTIVELRTKSWRKWESRSKSKPNKKRWVAVAKLGRQARKEITILQGSGTLTIPGSATVKALPNPIPLTKGTVPTTAKLYKDTDPYSYAGKLTKETYITFDAKRMFGTAEYLHLKLGNKGYYVKGSDVSMDTYKDQTGLLFVKEPTIADVKQGEIGDCYLLAAIASIVNKDPNYVKGMMRDNRDGTVTVRLYNVVEDPPKPKTFTPRYVQVKKSIVVKKSGATVYAGGALWVQMLEKAYAAAGFTGGKAMQPSGTPTFAAIKGGSANIALERLTGEPGEYVGIKTGGAGTKDHFDLPWGTLEQAAYTLARLFGDYEGLTSYEVFKGDDAEKSRKIETWMAFLHTDAIDKMFKAKTGGKYKEEIRLEDFAKVFQDKALDATVAKEMMAWIESKKLYPGKRGTGKYTQEQLDLFARIKKDIDDGDFVTVSTKKVVAKSPTGVGHSGGESMGKGLVGGHAYTVVSYKPKTPKETDVRFVKLRNPWGSYGRRYEKDDKGNWKAVEVKGGTGEFWLELSDLTKRFYAIKKAG